jgi:hypothetical protein
MSNVYLMTFEPSGVQREAVLTFMEQNESVVDYHASVPSNFVVVVSSLSAEALGNAFKGVGNLNTFVFVRIQQKQLVNEVFGWMPQTMWDFINRHFASKPVTPVEVRPAPTDPQAAVRAEEPAPA